MASLLRRLRIGKDGNASLPAGVPDFESRIGYHFRRRELLLRALTHRSWAHEQGLDRLQSNERLEFLGDAVLGLLINESLILDHPNRDEGDLTKIKSLLASRAILAEVSMDLKLGEVLLISPNEEDSGGRERVSILADAFEALLAAVYLDGGLKPARQMVETSLLSQMDRFLADASHVNYKSRLQEKLQLELKVPPRYRVESSSGPDHAKEFLVTVTVMGDVIARGTGRSKKDAEQDAARAALEQLASGGEDSPPASEGEDQP